MLCPYQRICTILKVKQCQCQPSDETLVLLNERQL